MENKKMYLSTGEFAKLCNVTKHTLFHYNDIEVFMPQYVDENGYRYYHVLQYDTFCTISQLRNIGMSLLEIKEYLDNRSPEKLISLCSSQEDLIEIRIKQLKNIKDSLKDTRQDIEASIASRNEISIRKEAKEHLILSKVLEEADDSEMTLSFGDLMQSVEKTMFRPISGMIHRTSDLVQGNYNKYCLFYLRIPCKKKNCGCRIKPVGEYVQAYHYGGYETLGITYKKIISYAQERSIELDEYFYEEIVVGDWAVKNTKEYVLKVSVKIV